jgi:hypothetical protein
MTTQTALSGAPEKTDRLALRYDILLICLVAAASVILTMQGWKSRIVAFDNLTYVYDAETFLKTGALPQHGDTDSYGSYSPPGTAWLMLPGMLLFKDPRLFEYLSAALLHLAALIGVFLLARRFFGSGCAYLSVVLYGLSGIALFYAGSLWPIGRPDFYVWTVLFACMWVLKNDVRYLSASLIVWALGMYVDMSIIPIFFIYPVLWLYYRPPLAFKSVFIAVLVGLLAWLPYLHFEVSRQFIDIRSQLLQQHVPPTDYKETWCDPSLTLRTWHDAADVQSTGLTPIPPKANQNPRLSPLAARLRNVGQSLLSNFDQIVPGRTVSIAFLSVMFISLVLLTASTSVKHQSWVTWVNLGILLGGAALGALGLVYQLQTGRVPMGGRFLFISKVSKIMLWSGMALLTGPWILWAVNRMLRRLHWPIQSAEDAAPTRILTVTLLVPWFILLLFAEPGKPERFMWLWPLQCIFLAAFATSLLPRFGISRYWIYASQVVLLLIVVGNSFLLQRINSWVRTGWAGQDADKVRVVDAIARDMRAEGKEQAEIGYQMFIYPFMAEYNIGNAVYKVGAELDFLLQFKDGLLNKNRCAEGLSPNDEYRIVETIPEPSEGSPKEYFPVTMDENLLFVGQFGSFQIYKWYPLPIDD